MVGRLLANRTASPFSGAAGMPRNQWLACVGITGSFASECGSSALLVQITVNGRQNALI